MNSTCPTSPGAHPRGGRSALARARTTQCAPPARAAAPPQAPAPPDAPFLLVPCMPLVCVLYVTLYGSTCNLRVQHAVLRLEEHHRLQSVPHLWVQSLRGGGGGEPEASPGG